MTSEIAGSWQLDPVHSEVGFAVTYNEIGSFRGGFSRFQGELRADGDTATLEGSAPAAAVAVKDENLYGHLLSPEFFDAERHPEISLKAISLKLSEDGSVSGEATLSMKGHEASFPLSGAVAGPVGDAFGGTRITLELSGQVDRHLLGLDWNAPLPSGGQALGDLVTVFTSAQLVKAEV